jgi:hypothetical protein
MGHGAERITVPTEMRKQIKHEQGCRCLVCGNIKKEQDLAIHHIQPVSHHSKGRGEVANRRENLCALCGDCHNWADHLALEKGVYLNELIDMNEGVYYYTSASAPSESVSLPPKSPSERQSAHPLSLSSQ